MSRADSNVYPFLDVFFIILDEILIVSPFFFVILYPECVIVHQ